MQIIQAKFQWYELISSEIIKNSKTEIVIFNEVVNTVICVNIDMVEETYEGRFPIIICPTSYKICQIQYLDKDSYVALGYSF